MNKKNLVYEDVFLEKKFCLFEILANKLRSAVNDPPTCFVDYSKTLPISDRYVMYPELQEIFVSEYVETMTNRSYEDVLSEQIKYIINEVEKTDKKIAIWWSGGIDSTAILVGFLKNAGPSFLKERVVIRGNSSSIAEYPLFFNKFIENKLLFLNSTYSNFFDSNYINIDGIPGDLLFGIRTSVEMVKNGVDYTNEPISRFEEYLNTIFYDKKKSEWFYYCLNELFKRFRVDTIQEGLNIYELSIKLQTNLLAPYLFNPGIYYAGNQLTLSEKIKEKFILQKQFQLYSSPKFIKYGLDQRKIRTMEDPRVACRKYILEYTNDNQYYLYKGKVYSQYKLFGLPPISKMYDDFSYEFNVVFQPNVTK